jgi:hypothetical protein
MNRTLDFRCFLLGTLLWCSLASAFARAVNCTSPNGKVCLGFEQVHDDAGIFVISHVTANGRIEVLSIPSFGIATSNDSTVALTLLKVSRPKKVVDDYKMVSGKRSHCHNEGREYTFSFKNKKGCITDMIFRLYDDGIAFRYHLHGSEKLMVKNENTTYRIAEGKKRWIQKYKPDYEGFYPMATSGVSKNTRWAYPALIQAGSDSWVLITEAGINRGYNASFLNNGKRPTDYQVQWGKHHETFTFDWFSPWRTLLIGSLADIVESTLVTDVSEPCKLKDCSWIEPGSVSWIYWAYNHGSKDFAIVKKYIDFAAQMHFPYVLIDWEWDVMGNGGTIDDALRYAQSKGVKVLLWYNSSTAWASPDAAGPLFKLNDESNREREFSRLEKLGVAGVKIDFFDGDSEETMDYCIDLLESAARHHLLVNFHGATLPRGWQRTYPNLMTTEAVYGAEWYNNTTDLTHEAARHNATLPFTRNVVGPMDYTPCTFSNSQHPHTTTYAHELALPVVFESALLHWADSPQSYLKQPQDIRDFMSSLPTVWDDTRLLSGYPSNYIVIARRKGQQWYVGALNGTDEARDITVDCSFLSKGSFRCLSIQDGERGGSNWNISEMNIDRDSKLQFRCRPRGGFVLKLTPRQP